MFGIVSFILFFALWILFSGKLDLFHLSLGVLSSALVSLFSSSLFFQDKGKNFLARICEAWRFSGYILWLLYQILLANFHVVGMALSGRRLKEQLDPHIFSFRTVLKNDFSKFVLANSITLTPGTVTIRIHHDMIYVHAISKKAAGELADLSSVSDMERRVAGVFERDNMCYLPGVR